MAGARISTRKRKSVEDSNQRKQNGQPEEVEVHDNGINKTPKKKLKQFGVGKGKIKSSPRKLNKSKDKDKPRGRSGAARARFQEDENVLVFEVEGVEEIFPNSEEDEEDRHGVSEPTKEPETENNNATLSRADRFWRMVSRASAERELSADRSSAERSTESWMDDAGPNHEVQRTSSFEESEASEDDQASNSSFGSVKILLCSEEDVAQEKAEMEAFSAKVVEQAVDKTFHKIAQLMHDNGFIQDNNTHRGDRKSKGEGEGKVDQSKSPCRDHDRPARDKSKQNQGKEIILTNDMGETVLNSTSNTTIYDRAVQQMDATSQCVITSQKRVSSLSEDNGVIDTSDEMIEVRNQVNNIVIFRERSGSSGGNRDCDGDHYYDREPEPGPSNYCKDSEEATREYSAEMTREAEASMVRVFDPKGKQDSVPNIEQGKVNHYVEADRSPNHMGIRHLPAEVDEDYLLVGNYVEDHIRQRIKNGEYVDFARLLPRDRLVMDEDN